VTTEELARRTGGDPEMLAYVLADELARGRIRQAGAGWAIVPAAFAPGVLEALRQLSVSG
jgi:hypothetical protein